MNLLWLISLCLLLLYFLRMLSFRAGWSRITGSPEIPDQGPDHVPDHCPDHCPDVSVVVPVRNEAQSVGRLLEDLAGQDYPEGNIEILLVDDHSTDGTPDILRAFVRDRQSCRHISLEPSESGKKAALEKGIRDSRYPLILTTDGDCRVPSGWLRSMMAGFSIPEVRMVAGAVHTDPDRGLFQAMQSLELHSLIASSAGSAGLNDPVLCSAANLAFYRADYLKYLEEEANVSESGDDIFLMLWLKRKFPRSIRFMASGDSVVRTRPVPGVHSFFMQRLRWSSKARHYRDPSTLGTAVLVFGMCALLFALPIAFLLAFLLTGKWEPGFIKLFGILFLGKSLADLLLLVPYLRHYRKSGLLLYFLPVQMIYFVYVSLTGVIGQFIPYTWKGRRVKVLKSNRTGEGDK